MSGGIGQELVARVAELAEIPTEAARKAVAATIRAVIADLQAAADGLDTGRLDAAYAAGSRIPLARLELALGRLVGMASRW